MLFSTALKRLTVSVLLLRLMGSGPGSAQAMALCMCLTWKRAQLAPRWRATIRCSRSVEMTGAKVDIGYSKAVNVESPQV